MKHETCNMNHGAQSMKHSTREMKHMKSRNCFMVHASCSKSAAFTLYELLIVIAITAALGAVGIANYFGIRNKNLLENRVGEIVADIRFAMTRARAQEENEQWNIRFTNPSGAGNDYYEMWRGTSYASGTIHARVQLPTTLRFTDPAASSTKDIAFSKATGLPTASSTIVVELTTSGNTGTINIDLQGRVEYSVSN